MVVCEWCSALFDKQVQGASAIDGRMYCSKRCAHEHQQAKLQERADNELREG